MAYWEPEGYYQLGEGTLVDISAKKLLTRMQEVTQAHTLSDLVVCPGSRLVLLTFVLLLVLFATEAQAWEGILVSVHDGDTVVVAPHGAAHGALLVRLYGIDAPELAQVGGREAHAASQNLVQPGDAVSIVPLSGDPATVE